MVTPNGNDRLALLQRLVAHDRAALRYAIERAQDAAKRQLDVPGKVADHRWAWLGAGFALGVIIGMHGAGMRGAGD